MTVPVWASYVIFSSDIGARIEQAIADYQAGTFSREQIRRLKIAAPPV